MIPYPDAAVPTGTCPCPLFWTLRWPKPTWPKGGAITGTGRNLAIFTNDLEHTNFFINYKEETGSRNEAKNSRGVLSWRVMRASWLKANERKHQSVR